MRIEILGAGRVFAAVAQHPRKRRRIRPIPGRALAGEAASLLREVAIPGRDPDRLVDRRDRGAAVADREERLGEGVEDVRVAAVRALDGEEATKEYAENTSELSMA